MGYVHDTAMSKFIAPSMVQFSAGTWADAVASNVWSKNRSAGDASFVIKIPVTLPGNSVTLKGCKLVSIDLWWDVDTAAMDAVSAALYKTTLAASGSAPTAAAVTTSYDAAHDTAGERLTAADHKMTLTLSTPEWIDEDAVYYVELSGDAAATSVFKFYGARANFTLRV